MNDKLTSKQTERQDEVDNACYALLLNLSGKTEKELPWDIYYISKIRQAAQEVVVDNLDLMTEMEFYPYIEEE